MDKSILPLTSLNTGEKSVITAVLIDPEMKRRLYDLGFIKGSVVEPVSKSICGDPRAYFIKGAVIALRNDDAKGILVKRIG